MRLTVFSDHALRVLAYLARHPNRFVTIQEIAGHYGVSGNHLMKVVQHLAANGLVLTLRGPRGGLRLARPAQEIRIGDVVRGTEAGLIAIPCGTRGVLDRAMMAFMAVLDGCSVADLMGDDAPLGDPGDRPAPVG
jgi:Rrf2 family nitric oxide-sensitive transcriptional repressor